MTNYILPILLAGVLGLSAAAQTPGEAEEAREVEPVYRDRLDDRWTQKELEDVRAENQGALDPIEVREEQQEEEPPPFFNGGIPKTLPRYQPGLWPGYGNYGAGYRYPGTYYPNSGPFHRRY